MKKINLIISFFFLILLLGCRDKTGNQSLKLEKKKLTFLNTFSSNKWIYLLDSKGKEYISFADFVTAKTITFHSINTKEKWSIELKDLMKSEKERFVSYFPITTDSIILLSSHTNKIYLINRQTKILKKIDQSKLLLDGIEFSHPIYFEKNHLYYAIHHSPLTSLRTKNDLKIWDAENLKKSIIAKTPINFHSTPPTQMGENLILRFMKSNQLPAEGTHFYFNKSKIYYYSAYNDTIYTITENTNIPLMKVKSNIGKAHVIASTREEYYKNTNCINEEYLKQSFICDILHDNNRDLMYVIVRKPKVDDYFPFNLLVYDKTLKKLDEIAFDGKEHEPYGFVGKKGLYLNRKSDQNPKQKSFDLFNYENH